MTLIMLLSKVAKVFPIFANTMSTSDIDLEIKNVQKAILILKEGASTRSEGVLVDTHKLVERTGREVPAELHAIRHNTVSALLGTQALSRQVSQVEDIIQPIPVKIEVLEQSMDELAEKFATGEKALKNSITSMANRAAIHAQNHMTRMLTDMRRGLVAMMEVQRRFGEMAAESVRVLQPTSVTQQGLLSVQELLKILAAPSGETTKDLKSVVQEGLNFGPAQQGEAEWLLKQDRFWQWYSAIRSEILLVHGNLTGTSNDIACISSLSVVSATIASAITQQDNSDAFALYYFCGLRISSNDDLSGPQGLVRCLTSRLVVGLKARYGITANVNFVDGMYIEALQRRDIRYLCAIFRSIVAQYPPSATVYCVLDGIAWYERSDMLEDLFSVVQSLYDLVKKAQQGPVLKVLLTSPFRSRSIVLDMPTEQQIFLYPEAMIFECEPSERTLLSHLGASAHEVPEYGIPRARARRIPSDEDEQWTEEDYN